MTLTLPKAVADFSKQLADSVSIADVVASLNSGLDADGNQLTNQKIYGFTVDAGSRKEYIVAYLDNNTELSQIVSISRQGAATTGFVKSHNVGASVQITDWALLSRITNMLNGTTDWDAGVPLKYDATPAQTNPLALATVQFVLDTASGATVLAFNPQTVDGVVGEGVTNGDWVYFKEADGKWWKTDADVSASSVGVKIGKVRATTLANSGVTGGIFISGTETVATYVAGTTYYISNTASALSTSAGTNSVKVGVGDQNGDLLMTHTTVVDASETVKGIVEEATQAEVTAGTAVGATGARLFINPSTLVLAMPTRKIYFNIGLEATQFDISNPSGTTFRYTDDLSAARSGITATTVPIGTILNINVAAFANGNRGTFTVTGSGANYFEVTNAAGVVEINKLIGSGTDRIQVGGTTWTKPATLKWVHIQAVASGGGGGFSSGEGGGGAGEFIDAFVSAASLGATETVTVGKGGNLTSNGNDTVFGSLFTLIAGLGTSTQVGGKGGGASYVDANGRMRIRGGNGQAGDTSENIPGSGGVSFFGGSNTHSGAGGPAAGEGPGAWGSGGVGWGGINSHGATGVLIITEHYV